MTLTTLPQVSTQEWTKRIALRAGVDVTAVDAVLARFGITVQSVAPRRRSMTLSSVRMCGTKTGLVDADHQGIPDQDFEYEWKGLRDGLWVLASDKNSAGKSSILNAFRSAVKGKFPGSMKPDVWKWLSAIDVSFVLDNVEYRTRVRKPAGSERVTQDAGFSACMERLGSGTWSTLISTTAGNDFEDAVSDFFMQELGFDKFRAYQAKTETMRQHGWPAMGSALFLTKPADALFGDEVNDGLAIRLLQLFIGLPWISTNSAVNAALKQVEAENERANRISSSIRRNTLDRIAALRLERAEQVAKQRSLPNRAEALSTLRSAEISLVAALKDIATEEGLLASSMASREAAESALVEDRNRLQQVLDDKNAGYAFRRLRPKSCPSCDAAVIARDNDHANGHACLLCGQAAEPDDDTSEILADAIRAQIAEARQAKASCEADERAARERLSDARGRKNAADQAHADAAALLSGDDEGAEIERNVIGIDARIAELEASLAAVETPTASAAHAVLRAAAEITEPLVKGMQSEVLEYFSGKLFDTAAAIGVENLRSVEVKSNRIDIVQGDTNLTFTKLNRGEKLRFRTAAALAAVETSNWAGVGRHPGFLVLDSPGSEEMDSDAFGAFLARLTGVLTRHPDVQVIVGALMRPEILESVPRDRLEYAEGEAKLF